MPDVAGDEIGGFGLIGSGPSSPYFRRLRRISPSMSRMLIFATPERLAVAQLCLSQAGAGAMVSR